MHSTLENYSKRRSRRIGELLLIVIIAALTLSSMANTVEERDDEPREESIATNNPRFVSKGETRELREGETTKLECLVEDLGEFVILWKLNRTNILFAGTLRINRDERFSISNDGSMAIKTVQTDLNGEYSCQISTNPPQEIVYIIKVLTVPQIHSRPESGELIVRQNDLIQLECNVSQGSGSTSSSPARITWRKVNDPIPTDHHHENPSNADNSKFIIRKADRQHSGLYECVAVNAIGESSIQFRVRVQYAPEVTASEKVIHSWIGQSINITCDISAEPQPLITWFKGRDPQTASRVFSYPNKLRIYPSFNNTSTLQVTLNEFNDFGEYTCFANNSLGHSMRTVEVTRKPSMARFTSSHLGNSEESYELLWSIDSKSPITSYILRIRNDEEDTGNEITDSGKSEWRIAVIEPNSDSVNENGVTRTQSYTIDNLNRLTRYETDVEAFNEFGSTRSDIFSFTTSAVDTMVEQIATKTFADSIATDTATVGKTLHIFLNIVTTITIIFNMLPVF